MDGTPGLGSLRHDVHVLNRRINRRVEELWWQEHSLAQLVQAMPAQYCAQYRELARNQTLQLIDVQARQMVEVKYQVLLSRYWRRK